MWQIVFGCCVVLLTLQLHAQPQQVTGGREAAIRAAKDVLISTFDRSLPNISLEYFLKYESDGVPIDWTVVTCDERATSSVIGHDRPLCVQATVDNVRAQRSAVVLLQVGTIGAGVVGTPKLRLVMAQDENGACHAIHLIELPAAMHRWRPRRIRDLPERLGAIA